MSQSFDVELIPRVQSVEKKMRFSRIEKQERNHEGKGRHHEERKPKQQTSLQESDETPRKIDITV